MVLTGANDTLGAAPVPQNPKLAKMAEPATDKMAHLCHLGRINLFNVEEDPLLSWLLHGSTKADVAASAVQFWGGHAYQQRPRED